MSTEANTALGPARAACEAFWAAVGAGPGTQEPGAAWDWAFSQGTTRAWEAAAKAAAAAGRDDEELTRLRDGGRTLGRIVVAQARAMRAASIEMAQNGPHAAMQWILNSIPPPVDEGDGEMWDGKETAQQWFDRVEAAERTAGARVSEDWCIAWGGEDANDCVGRLEYDDEAEAHEMRQWIDGGIVARQMVIRLPWETVPAEAEGESQS